MSDRDCPDLDTLQRFAAQELPADATTRVDEHLDRCASCRERLADSATADGATAGWSKFPPLVEPLERPRISCPTCHAPIDEGDESRSVITCRECGSAIRLAREAPVTRPPADKIGRYEIHEPLGGGAFGTVYRGRDPQLDRSVAIKIPRDRALASSDGFERFEREARSVAQLSHSLIVTIYDVGIDDGVPYLVSEYVQGVTLADRLAAWRPSFQQSAQLLAQIADALDEAHRASVIHRDVKPGNIMIDEQGRPRIMDFGLAMRQTDEVTMTVDGAILGTPAYMSPEQAGGRSHEVDARADVYSLGVIFYEMLTGVRPFQGDPRMVVRQVLDDEPRAPRRLNDRIPRDLETICLKAMDKSPARRYATAGDLAEDLRCWLTGLPITARPTGKLERAWRRCRRFPRTSALAATAVVLLVAVAVTASVGYWRATQLRRTADALFQRAEQNFQLAWDQVDRYFVQISENRLLGQPGLQPLRRDLLQDAATYYEQFARDRAGDPRVQMKVAESYMRIGLIDHILGDRPGSQAAYRDALATLDRMPLAMRGTVDYEANRAQCLRSLGVVVMETGGTGQAEQFLADATPAFEALAAKDPQAYAFELGRTHLDRARLLRQLNRLDDELETLNEAERVIAALVERDAQPANLIIQSELFQARAALYQLLRRPEAGGEYGKAMAVYDRLRELVPGDAHVEHRRSRALYDWAIYLVVSDPDKSRRLFIESADALGELVRLNPAVPMYRLDRARALMNVAAHAILVRDHETASTHLDQALTLLEELDATEFSTYESQSVLARGWLLKSQASRAAGDTTAVLAAMGNVIAARRKLADAFPDQPQLGADVAHAYSERAQLHFDLGQFSQAAADHQQAVDVLVKLAAGEGGDRFKLQLSAAWAGLGNRQLAIGKLAEAEHSFQAASDALESLDGRPDDVEWLGAQATVLEGIAQGRLMQMRFAEALPRFEEALGYRRRAAEIASQFVDVQFRHAEAHRFVASSLYALERLDGAKAHYEAAAAILEPLHAGHPQNVAVWESLPLVLGNLALIAQAENQRDEVVRRLTSAESIQRDVVAQLASHAEHLSRLAWLLDSLGQVHRDDKSFEAARAACAESVEILKNVAGMPGSQRFHEMLVTAWVNKILVLRASGEAAAAREERAAAERFLEEHDMAPPVRAMFLQAVGPPDA